MRELGVDEGDRRLGEALHHVVPQHLVGVDQGLGVAVVLARASLDQVAGDGERCAGEGQERNVEFGDQALVAGILRHAIAAQRIEDRAEWERVLSKGVEDTAAYLDYLTTGATGERQLVADVTPAYGLLPEARLAQMAGLMPDVRFLYLMRDWMIDRKCDV